MNIITQKFKNLSTKIIYSLKNKEIKAILGRKRLKFSYKNILHYVQIIFEHSLNHKSFKNFYKKDKIHITYQGFMKNIQLFSSIFKFLFAQINKLLNIVPSSLLNIVDSTLIPEKQSVFINQNDWNLNHVTTRFNKSHHKTLNKDNKDKNYTCGSKGLIFINRFGKIYLAQRLNINYSDQNVLKDFSFYIKTLKGILLADRGFSNKSIRERLKGIKNSIFNKPVALCKLISPYHYKSKETLSKKEFKLYKRRWKIETVFQKLKHNYSEFKLNLTGNYSEAIKGAKFYCSLINFNLTTT